MGQQRKRAVLSSPSATHSDRLEPKVRLRKPEVASRVGQQRERAVLIQLASAFKELG